MLYTLCEISLYNFLSIAFTDTSPSAQNIYISECCLEDTSASNNPSLLLGDSKFEMPTGIKNPNYYNYSQNKNNGKILYYLSVKAPIDCFRQEI